MREPNAERERSRAGRARVPQVRSDRYALFFALLVVDIVLLLVLPARPNSMLIAAPFVAATLLLGLYTSDASPRTLRWAAIAALIVVVVSAVLAITGNEVLGGLAWLMLGALIFATPWTILRHIFSERAVTLRTIFAAVSVYLLIGLAFTFLDLGIQGVTGSFFGDPDTAGSADFTYFSYIVMTTIGFGDLTPAGSLPRASAVLEGIIAQIFLVTTVARLVSLYGMGQQGRSLEARAEPSSSADEGAGAP